MTVVKSFHHIDPNVSTSNAHHTLIYAIDTPINDDHFNMENYVQTSSHKQRTCEFTERHLHLQQLNIAKGLRRYATALQFACGANPRAGT